MNCFDGSTVLITGASSGIGAEFARQLATRAGTLILVARRTDRLKAIQEELNGRGAEIRVYGLDVSDEAAADAFIEWLAENDLHVTLLVNNAGLGDYGTFAESDWGRVKAMIEVNMLALTRFTHRLLPEMIAAGRGTIINISSSAGSLPIPQLAVYAATKSYVTSFSEALRIELLGSGVGVTAVCPGPVPTEFGDVAQRGGKGGRMDSPEFIKIPAAEVVRVALCAASRNRARVVPGWLMAALMLILAATPMFVMRSLLRRRR